MSSFSFQLCGLFLFVLLTLPCVILSLPQLTFSDHYSSYNCGATHEATLNLDCAGVVFFNNAYHMFFKDPDGNGLMHIYSNDGINWLQPSLYHINNEVTSVSPFAIASPDGTHVHVFFRDGDGNGILHIIGDQSGSFVQAPDYYIQRNTDYRPEAAIALSGPHQGTICVVGHDASGKGLVYSVLDSNSHVISTGTTGYILNNNPTIIWFANAFHVYFQAWDTYSTPQQLQHIQSQDGIHWSAGNTLQLGVTTSSGPSAVIFPGGATSADELLLFFRDGNECTGTHCDCHNSRYCSDDGLLFISSTNAQNFTASQYTGLNIEGSPSATFDPQHNRLMIAGRDAGGDGIMYSLSS